MMFIVFLFLCIFSSTACGAAGITVAKDGSGNFTTISAALKAAPNESTAQVKIFIKKGTYNEFVNVTKEKHNIVFIGDGMDVTIITNNRSNATGSSTFNSSTLAVDGYGFIAMNLTIQNTAGPSGNQAVALRSSSNHSAFYNCGIYGYQDTLYAQQNIQFYRQCKIIGTVDFIFGAGPAVFQRCQILARQLPNQENTITANGRASLNETQGFSIHLSTIDALNNSTTKANNGSSVTYLGRPWRQYSTTVIMQSNISSVVDGKGWTEWSADSTSYDSTVFYAEYNNTGGGAVTGNRVKWPGYHPTLPVETAKKYTVSNFIDGDAWLPFTGIPYDKDLIPNSN